ncbi:hypothetical protein PG999_007109 [Apiospora kogelbergensis]|uniref:Ankyrin repeat-containing protein n=1 Tax=Apiospora kogelbergensis TaxID=1337665 RepID=A0AAW0QXD5_9PEZI
MDEPKHQAVESSAKPVATSPKRPSDTLKPPPAAPTTAATTTTTATSRSPLKELNPPEEDGTSDAETIVLHKSPAKSRKVITIKHEENSEGEIGDTPVSPKKVVKDGKDGKDNKVRDRVRSDDVGEEKPPLKKKRPLDKDGQHRTKDAASSGLSSVPASPPLHPDRQHNIQRRRRSSASESEHARPRSPRLVKDKAKSVDRQLKRKAPKAESDDEDGLHKARRPRISEQGSKPSSGRGLHDKHTSRARSNSPQSRLHRRSASTQLPAQSSNGVLKKRRPAPLMSTDYQSDDSSASGSPHPRSSRLKSIATPLTGDSTASPAKMHGVHKKHLDAHGQTLFAKACAKGEYDVAKMRLQERPEDLNFSDHAGNTPLQVACLNGHEDVVKLLIEAGCNLDCRNDDKDTPLLDAVENGHLAVVKLLVAAGVNPRRPNAEGQEPLEKIPDDVDNADEIRAALMDARTKMGELRRTSEDHQLHDQDTSSHGADSPRRSPAASVSGAAAAASRRGGTVRSTKTSNHLLYMSLDEKTLRQAAARGDSETVTRILQVKESCDDAEALVAAARGGHNFVIELLLALGGANPDPAPVKTLPSEHSTPMLAAIGGENTKVIQLLLNQSLFDPTRRYKGETYYEIARRREGPMWKEEEHMLKDAYDDYRKSHRISKAKSPSHQKQDHEAKRAARPESIQDNNARPQKRRPSSPPREPDSKKKLPPAKPTSSPKEKRRQSISNMDETSPKRGPGRPKKDDKVPAIAISDREASPAVPPKTSVAKPKRTESEVAGSSEGETAKPRRKLISGRDLKGRQQDKQRRSSVVSNISARDASDRGDGKHDDNAEKPRAGRLSEKYHDRTKALKRDDSKDRLSVGDGSSKRHRSSVTPPRQGTAEKDEGDGPAKRRRLDVEGKEKRPRQGSSPDDRQRKRDLSRDSIKRQKSQSHDERKDLPKPKKIIRERKEMDYPSSEEKASITVFSEDMDIEMRDTPPASISVNREVPAEREKTESKKRQAEQNGAAEETRKKDEAKKREEAKQRAEAKQREETKQREEAEKRKREVEEKEKRRREAEEKEKEKRQQEEAERKRREEEEKRSREEAERKEEERRRKEAEEKLRLEAEQKKREEEERLQREEEERKRKEEEERQRLEEERLRLEKEAAEEARKLREEEERKERERKRAAREAEQLRIFQEQEKIRLAKLPPLLRWLDGCPNPKRKEYAELFTSAQGVRYDTIKPDATGKPDGREQWLLNTQVALLLGEKDLNLSRYTAWERIPVSPVAKRVIWRVEQDRYALTEGKLYHLGEQLPDYYGGDPSKVPYQKLEQLRGEASKLFFETDMFFVKESDFLFILPNFPHLRNVRLSICYRELPEHESQLNLWSAPAKWKQDPDANSREGFAPRQKYYINGQFVAEDKPGHYKPSNSPFPEPRVPRRGGLVAVGPDEPDYPRLCVEQGLGHLLTEQQKLSVTNGAHLTPRSMTSNDTAEINGAMSPSAVSPTAQLNGVHDRAPPEKPLVNGINGINDIPTTTDGGH